MQDARSPAELLEEAIACIDRGWHIFPCHSALDGRCTCGNSSCKNVGKHPRTKNGLKDATTAGAKIKRWWSPHSRAASNIAIATGAASGFVVIDVDPRHGGDETLESLEAELGELPRDCSVRTGGGGVHVYLRYPDGERIRSRNGWRQGVDVKADGAYVVAPPSLHESGARYQWGPGIGPPPPIPSRWLAVLVAAHENPQPDRRGTADAHARLLQRAQQYAAKVSGESEGRRNSAAFGLAGNIAALESDAGDRLDEDEVLEVLRSWNSRCSPPLGGEELKSCVTSALTNGTPRTPKILRLPASSDGESIDAGPSPADKSRPSQATLLVALTDEAYLFHDPDGEAFARFPVGEGLDFHWQVARIRTRQFRRRLTQRFYRAYGKAPSSQAFQDAVTVIEATALFDGDMHDVFLRVAHRQDRIYFDLANDRWQVVEIDRHGWRVLDQSPVMFRRPKAMLPSPTPASGGSLQELRR